MTQGTGMTLSLEHGEQHAPPLVSRPVYTRDSSRAIDKQNALLLQSEIRNECIYTRFHVLGVVTPGIRHSIARAFEVRTHSGHEATENNGLHRFVSDAGERVQMPRTKMLTVQL